MSNVLSEQSFLNKEIEYIPCEKLFISIFYLMFKNLCFLLLILSQVYTANIRMLRDGERGNSRYSYSGSSTRNHDRQP